MDKERVAGAGNQAKGSVKQAIGKVTGDAKIQAEGSADKAVGKAQKAASKGKRALRDAEG